VDGLPGFRGGVRPGTATRALTALDFPAAEDILARLVATHPDFAEAWNKRATLYYMQSRDEESVASIHRTLELEPRHYGAICGFAQICLSLGDTDSALFASTRRCASTLTWRECARRSINCSAPAPPRRFTKNGAGESARAIHVVAGERQRIEGAALLASQHLVDVHPLVLEAVRTAGEIDCQMR